MTNKLEIILTSIDGKIYHDFIDALYVDIPDSGVMGILPNRIPLVALLHIGTLYTIKDSVKKFYAFSGGVLNYKNSVAKVLCDTFESEDEIDVERVLKAKARAEEKIKQIESTDTIEYDDADFALKKAINRLKIKQ